MNFDETTIRTLEGYVPTYAAYGVALNRVYCFRQEKICNIQTSLWKQCDICANLENAWILLYLVCNYVMQIEPESI